MSLIPSLSNPFSVCNADSVSCSDSGSLFDVKMNNERSHISNEKNDNNNDNNNNNNNNDNNYDNNDMDNNNNNCHNNNNDNKNKNNNDGMIKITIIIMIWII